MKENKDKTKDQQVIFNILNDMGYSYTYHTPTMKRNLKKGK